MDVDEKYVIEAARQAGLELDPERLRAVLGNLQRIAQLAQRCSSRAETRG